MEEIFKHVNGYENYSISNLGRVVNTITEKELIGDINNCGYRRVTLRNNNKSKKFFIHRLVAMMFCENYEEHLVVNHIDGNKSNNKSINLECVTRSENDIHAFSIGLRKGNNTKPKNVALCNSDNGKIIKKYNSAKDAALDNNTTSRGIYLVCNGTYSQWLGKHYKYI